MRLTYQGQEVRRSTEVTDKRLAERIYHKLLGQIAEGKWFERLPGDEKTVEDLLERYLRDHSASNKAPSTYRRDQSLAAHLIHAFGNRPLTTVRPAMIAEYKAQRRDYGAAPKTINDEIKLLSHAFKLAMKEWEWVTVNPVDRVSREKVYNQIERWLSLDEEQRLLAASPRWLQEIIVFAIHTGLRQGEILNLQWSQIDLFRRTMILLEQKNRCKDTLPLNDSALEVLKARGRERSTETDYVFFNQV
ncbi:MAG: tyrosine-type recombinase/integrase, partial [Nitrospirota bacterium]|nr:tyrosine-type recombinase/integrase [Nitrospirota bacterium]